MDSSLRSVWESIEKNKEYGNESCGQCPLLTCKLLLIKPTKLDQIGIMVITEGPNRPESIEVLTSPLNHPTFTFLYTIFRGNFRPLGCDANVYWTHVRKCFLDKKGLKEGREAIHHCQHYISSEISSLKPKLIVTVGMSALRTAYIMSLDERLNDKLESAFLRQQDGIYREVKLGNLNIDVAVLPHPSGRNVFWNNPPEGSLTALRKVQESIKKFSQKSAVKI